MSDLNQDPTGFVHQDDLVCRMTPGEVFTYVSPAFSREFQVSAEQLLHEDINSVVHEAWISQVRSALTRIKESLRQVVFETSISTPEYGIRWWKWTMIPLVDDGGNLVEIVGSGAEITHQKHVEMAFNSLNQVFRAIYKGLELPEIFSIVLEAATQVSDYEMGSFLLCNGDREIKTVSTRGMETGTADSIFEDLFKSACQKSLAEIGTHGLLLDANELKPGILADREEIKSAKLLLLADDDHLVGALGLASAVHSTLLPDLLPVLEYLSMQAAAVITASTRNAVLIQRVDNLHSVFDTITEMLFLISQDGTIFQVNRAVTRTLGYSDEECIGKHFNFLQPESAKEEFAKITRRISELREGSFRIPFLTRDEKQLQVEMDLTYGVWEKQEILIAVCRDVSYRMEIERSEREQRVLASALADVGAILNSSLNLDVVLDRILDNVGKVIPNVLTNIMVVEGDQARVIRARGYESLGTDDLLRARVFQIKKVKNLYKMAFTLQPVVTEDTTRDPNWMTFPESLWLRSFVGAPITFQGKLFGFINCDSDQKNFYNRSHARKLKWFADQAGVAMANATTYTQARAQAHQLEMINDLTRIVLSSEDTQEVVDELMRRLLELFKAENVYLTRYDEETRTVFGTATTTPYSSSYSTQFSVSDEVTLTRTCLESGKAVYIPDIQQSDQLSERFIRLYNERSLLALPMISDGKKIGAIILGFKSFHVNTEEENSLGEAAAKQIGSVLLRIFALKEERNLAELLTHANALIAVLSKVGITVNSASGSEGVIESLLVELEKLQIHSLISLSDAQSGRQVVRYISRAEIIVPALERLLGKNLPDFVIPVEDFIPPNQSMGEKRTFFIEDPSVVVSNVLLPELTPFKKRIHELLCIQADTRGVLVPLILGGRVIGHLILWGESIKQIDQQAALIFADQIAAAIDNANLLEKVKLLAITDEMTGIYNRRGLNEYGKHELEISKRLNTTLSVIMFDIDHFKLVNDQFGHFIGDQVLCQIAHRCRVKIRQMDVFGRYGGEEFIVLLVKTGMEVAVPVAERIRKIIGNSPFHTDAGDIAITVSLGVAEINDEIDSIETLIKMADQALYQAKQNGRNQVAVWQKSEGNADGSCDNTR